MGVTPQIKCLMNKRNRNRNYVNGYEEKIGYWTYKLNQALEHGNVEKLNYANKRLVYFLQRQEEWRKENGKEAEYKITNGWV